MKIIKIARDDVYARLDKPFNPPIIDSEFTEEDFEDEWYRIRDQFASLLDKFGINDEYGEKDYNLGETLTLSRGIGLELTSDRMMRTELIPETQQFLRSLPQEYEIDFALLTEDGYSHIFVNRRVVRHNCPRALLKRLV